MSRVSDAMRRAGHHHDDEASIPDDTAFETGEEGADQTAEDHETVAVNAAATAAEPEPVIRGELVPQTIPAMPIAAATIERDSGEEIRLREVLRILYRRKWIGLGIVTACLAVALAYNYTAERIYQARA